MLTGSRLSALAFGGAVMILAGGALAGHARAQSLADVAKKEGERRKTTAEPAKVYTNKDLTKKGDGSPGASDAAPAGADAAKDATTKSPKESAKDDKEAAQDKDAAKAANKETKEPVKDRAYWLGRLKALEDKLLRDSNYLDAMQTRINALNTDFVNRDDPVQKSAVERDRQKAIAEQNRLKKDVVDDRKAIDDFQEEARRAGVPPGWLR
jgi:hypothetical protein